MAAFPISQHDNKENIPPFPPKQSPLPPPPSRPSSCKNHRGRPRKPLEDVTHLLVKGIAPGNQIHLSSHSLGNQVQGRYGKKKPLASGLDSMLVHKSRNFR
ncbi:hypothetical protein SLEP1_g23096 [Rubroshorea leprosula]|uniref:Uncharacterized protein n=1 Tax=Rubroshorea leprosula TaxID=152421 RepID=A0AAV5JHF0_9ROSI|nr:hypothetical protein SLEP1_g23096 [Rubroshorea leprosula]